MSGNDLTDRAGSAARQAANSKWLERTARVGFVVNGVLHLLIAYIALRVAWTGAQGNADQSGALGLLADSTWGRLVLWVGVFGFAALALWQLTEAFIGASRVDSKEQAAARGKALAKAVVYLALAVSSYSFAQGSGSSSKSQSKDFTASLMSQTGGRVLVVVVGLVVIAVGGYHVYKGWKRKFLEDLVGHPGTTVERLGVAGYIAKGIALAIVGLLFCVAGFQKQASKATGLDGALKSLREQPFGTWLLTLVALGIAAYGLYSFARARRARL